MHAPRRNRDPSQTRQRKRNNRAPIRPKRGKLFGIKIKFQPFARAKYDKAIIGSAQQVEHIAVARIIPRCASVRSGHAAMGIRIDRVTRGREPRLARIAHEIQRRLRQRHLGTRIAFMSGV